MANTDTPNTQAKIPIYTQDCQGQYWLEQDTILPYMPQGVQQINAEI